ncbi:MAG TPA: glutathione S-transferase N-terminal domain-containing protein [Candidatus Udaeobacter sp.]|nr:glutathione S-transferase N-terminal domain-containing protein [Candidatus Udaeobacter sp.]
MKLRYSPTSPYVRKVLVAAIETGLDKRIELVTTSTTDPASGLINDNPLGKVPALQLDDGSSLYDSPVICEYLDSLHSGPKLIPASGAQRWTVLRRQALADGFMDAAVLRRGEFVRPDGEKSPTFLALQRQKMASAADALEKEAASFGTAIDIGLISIACALGYADFRHAADEWRKGRPALAKWYEGFAKRPSIQRTAPPAQ